MRPAPAGWVHARTNDEARRILSENRVEEASLDHDLGYDGALPLRCEHCWRGKLRDGSPCPSCDGDGFVGGDLMYAAGTSEDDGARLAEWLAENPEHMPRRITIHSWNPHGAARMEEILRGAGASVEVRPYRLC